MNPKYYVQIIVAISVNLSICSINAQSSNYQLEDWPGKKGKVKTDIEFPSILISEHNLKLTKGSTDTTFIFKIPDSVSHINGVISIKSYKSIERAQKSLIEYLECIVSDDKPERISDNENDIGDVQFRKDYNNYSRIIFARNNCLVIIYAPSFKAIQVAIMIDESILKAPEHKNLNSRPSFKGII